MSSAASIARDSSPLKPSRLSNEGSWRRRTLRRRELIRCRVTERENSDRTNTERTSRSRVNSERTSRDRISWKRMSKKPRVVLGYP